MKKYLAILLIGLLALTGCSSKPKEEETAPGKDYKIGTAVLTSEKLADAGEEAGKFEVNTYYATVVLDGDKIASVYIDAAQNTIKVDDKDALVGFEGKGTKKELGDDYNMKTYGNAVAEWYEQIESLETWMTGQTLDEVLSMETYEKDESHPMVPAEEDLKSSVTVDVSAYLKVVEMAVANAVEAKDVVSVGTQSITSASKEGIEINTTIASVALNSKGEIAYAFIDAAQNKGESKAGVVTSKNLLSSKKQLGSDYNMKEYGNAVAEWDEQIASLEEYAVGLKLSDLLETPLKDGKADVEDLKSSVTIGVEGYLQAFDKAAKAATKID